MTLSAPIPAAACGCDCPELVARLMPVNEALAAGLALAQPVDGREEVCLRAARGRVLARPVTARSDMPRFDNSGMDGYALRLADLPASAALPVSGVCAAGDAPAALPPGTMMRIYTGAPVPRGADTVVMQEHVERSGGMARITHRPGAGGNIRRRGEDQRRGDEVLAAERLLDARGLAICAGAGLGTVTVVRKPKVGLLLTGDEIRPAGQSLEGGEIWDVNTPMLTALCEEAGADIAVIRHVPDRRPDLRAALTETAEQVDMVVTSGGVSVGDRDHLKPVLTALGARIAVSGVALKPGKPVTISRLGRAMVVSLPGNPVSAFVTWHLLGRPILGRLSGLAEAGTPRRLVRTGSRIVHKPGRCEYRPASIVGTDEAGLEIVSCGARTHSARLSPLAQSDGVVLITGDTACVEAGGRLEFLPF